MCVLCVANGSAGSTHSIGFGDGGSTATLPWLTAAEAASRIGTSRWQGVAPSTLTYSFQATSDSPSFQRLDAAQIVAVETVLGLFADVANINFNKIQAADGGSYCNAGTIRYSAHDGDGGFGYAWAFGPGSRAATSTSGDVFLNTTGTSFDDVRPDTYAFVAILHETGHALGLAHPGNYNGTAQGYAIDAGYAQDTRQYTVMSYFSASNTGADHKGLYASTPLIQDIAALQRLYGVNWSTRTDDTTYEFHSNADREAYHPKNSDRSCCLRHLGRRRP